MAKQRGKDMPKTRENPEEEIIIPLGDDGESGGESGGDEDDLYGPPIVLQDERAAAWRIAAEGAIDELFRRVLQPHHVEPLCRRAHREGGPLAVEELLQAILDRRPDMRGVCFLVRHRIAQRVDA